jgi:hypothetical protein
MANLQTFFIIDVNNAAQLMDATANQSARIDPRKIEGGIHKGKYAVPARLANKALFPEFAYLEAAFAVMTEVGMDIEEAWPPEEEA